MKDLGMNLLITLVAILLIPFYVLVVIGMTILGFCVGLSLAFIKVWDLIASAWRGEFAWDDITHGDQRGGI